MLIKSRKISPASPEYQEGSGTLRNFIRHAKRHRVTYHTVGVAGEVFYEYELDLSKFHLLELLKGDEALDEIIPPETDEFLPSHRSFYAWLDWAEGRGIEIVFQSFPTVGQKTS